jgi:hypothetical protein
MIQIRYKAEGVYLYQVQFTGDVIKSVRRIATLAGGRGDAESMAAYMANVMNEHEVNTEGEN